jgi:hypothetical protein
MPEITNYCPYCGAAIEEGIKFCPQCGKKIDNSPEAPRPITPVTVIHEQKRGATEHLTIGYSVALANPVVFLPALLSGIIGLVVTSTQSFVGLGGILVLQLVNILVSFILGFASTDMSRDAYNKQQLDLGQSIGYVFKRFVPFLIASIIGAILSFTVVLIPVVMFTFVIMVIDETGLMDALSKALKVILADFMDVVIVIIVAIVGFFVTGYIPYISTLLYSALNVIVGLAFIDIYVNYKNQ